MFYSFKHTDPDKFIPKYLLIWGAIVNGTYFQFWFPIVYCHYRHTSAILWVLFQTNQAKCRNKVSHIIFLIPSAYKSYVYTILKSIRLAIALCLKKQVHTLILKYISAGVPWWHSG